MTPNIYTTTGGISFLTEPERSRELKQAYKDGYEAGKAVLRSELKALIAKLPDKQVFTETSSTFTNCPH